MIAIDITWSEALRVAVTLGAIYGLIMGTLILAYMVSRPAVVSFIERRWAAWFISAGLILTGAGAVYAAFWIVPGHPASEALRLVSVAFFFGAIWLFVKRRSA